MYQDDSFGRAGYQGVRIALADLGMEPVAIGIYPRNTKAIKTALLDLRQGEPEAVIMIGAYEPVAHLISWARHTDFNPEFMTVSFVGSNALARELGEHGKRRLRYAGGTLPLGRIGAHRCRLSKRSANACSG